MIIQRIIYLNVILSILLSSCSGDKGKCCSDAVRDSCIVADSSLNYRHLAAAVNWYANSAEMKACYYQAYNIAKFQLDRKLKSSKAKKHAVVVDIDETLLDNSPFEAKCMETGKGYSRETWEAWTSLGKAYAVPGAVDFLNYAKANNVEVFYISNRKVNELQPTLKNLQNLNFPYADTLHTLFRKDDISKESRRKKVLENFEILLLIGDNLSDFAEVFDNRGEDMGKAAVVANKDRFGETFIVLPNPMYGDWEMCQYGDKKPKDSEKGKILSGNVKSNY